MTSALEGGECQRHAPAAIYPRKRPGTHFTGGWVGTGAGMDRCGKSRPTGIRSPDRPARSQSLYVSKIKVHMLVFNTFYASQYILCDRKKHELTYVGSTCKLGQRCTNTGYEVTMATKVFKLAPIICGSSVRNLLHVNRLMPGDGFYVLGTFMCSRVSPF
jgi:hypothetical protein